MHCMLSYIFEKKVLVILNYYKYGHAYIYIYTCIVDLEYIF